MVAALLLAPKIHIDIPPDYFVFLWVGLAGLMALLVYAGIRQRRQRREGLNQFAMESGFAFFETPDPSLADELAQIQLANAATPRRATYRNVLKGTFRFGEFIIADRSDVGNSSSTTIAAFKFSDPFPSFFLFPESGLFKLVEKLGVKDIDFPEAPEFSRRYFLHGSDEAGVREVFKPAVISAFEGMNDLKLCVVGSGRWLVVYPPNRTLPLDQLRSFRQQAETIAEAFRRSRSTSAGF